MKPSTHTCQIHTRLALPAHVYYANLSDQTDELAFPLEVGQDSFRVSGYTILLWLTDVA